MVTLDHPNEFVKCLNILSLSHCKSNVHSNHTICFVFLIITVFFFITVLFPVSSFWCWNKICHWARLVREFIKTIKITKDTVLLWSVLKVCVVSNILSQTSLRISTYFNGTLHPDLCSTNKNVNKKSLISLVLNPGLFSWTQH